MCCIGVLQLVSTEILSVFICILYFKQSTYTWYLNIFHQFLEQLKDYTVYNTIYNVGVVVYHCFATLLLSFFITQHLYDHSFRRSNDGRIIYVIRLNKYLQVPFYDCCQQTFQITFRQWTEAVHFSTAIESRVIG